MLKVKAADGVKVPLEHQPYAYIEQAVVEVEPTAYYQRRIADGDLIVINPTRKSKEATHDAN